MGSQRGGPQSFCNPLLSVEVLPLPPTPVIYILSEEKKTHSEKLAAPRLLSFVPKVLPPLSFRPPLPLGIKVREEPSYC